MAPIEILATLAGMAAPVTVAKLESQAAADTDMATLGAHLAHVAYLVFGAAVLAHVTQVENKLAQAPRAVAQVRELQVMAVAAKPDAAEWL
jgi:hypothetical protein